MTTKFAVKKKKSISAPVKSFKLKNGLAVLLIENHKSPVVSVQMWVKTGSADEKKGEEGISHFIEHLVFKGTETFKVGEIASTVEASGGELNAYTSFDQTVFYVNISKEFSDVGLNVVSQMMGFPLFEGGEIDNEREVVIEEIKRSNDSPGRQASRALFSTVFKKHPYGIPVIGYEKIIKKVSRKTMVDYFHSRYIPTNMDLVIAGDFNNSEMKSKVEKYFGRFNNYKIRKVKRKTEPKQTKMRINVVKAPFEEAQFYVAWRVPGAAHKDIAALDVLAMVLGQGDSSRLSMKMRLEKALTNSVGAGTFTPKEEGLFTISGSLNVDQTEEAFSVMKQEIMQLFKEAPTAEELIRAQVNMASEEFYAMETIEGVARKAGSFLNLMGDYKYFEKFLSQVNALKPEDISRVAKKYLTPEKMNLVMMLPRREKEVLASLKGWAKEYGREYKAAKLSSGKAKKPKLNKATKLKKFNLGGGSEAGPVIKRQLSSGATAFFKVNRSTPVFSVKAGFLGGVRLEKDERQGGLTELMSRTWTSGTKDMSETEIAKKIENMAGGLGAFGGRNSAGLSMQAISNFEEPALDLFEQVLCFPRVAESAVEREKTVMLETIKSREDNPSQVAIQMFSERMFDGHPYAKDIYGSSDSVKGLSVSQVTGFMEKFISRQNMMIAVCGNVDVDLWVDRLEKMTSHLRSGTVEKKEFKHRGPHEEIKAFKKLEREQTHIILGYKGLTLSDPRRYALQVIQSILAGQGGRLFIELRDKASLAYSVSPLRMEGIETGYFGAYIGCSPQKGEKAISMLKEEFGKLVDVKVSDSELERAKRYLIGRHDIDLQRNSAVGSSILFNEIYGISHEEVFKYAEYLREVSAKDVQDLAEKIFNQPGVICAVGSQQPWG